MEKVFDALNDVINLGQIKEENAVNCRLTFRIAAEIYG